MKTKMSLSRMLVSKILIFYLMAAVVISAMNIASAQAGESGIVGVSLINQVPDPAKAGEIVELKFRVENQGGKEVNSVNLELVLDYPFTSVPGENYVRAINTLAAYQQDDDAVIVKYKVRVDKDAVKGTNEIKMKETRSGLTGYTLKTFDVDISGREFAQNISIDTSRLEPGKETKIRFRITNLGNSPLENLVFSWEEAEGVILPVYSDDTKYIHFVDVGESVSLDYVVVADVDAKAGLYELNLKLLSEAEDSSSKEVSTKLGIFVGEEADGREFAQIVCDSPVVLVPGKEAKLKFTIKNIGNSVLNNLVFTWDEKNGVVLPVYSDDARYIKSLDAGSAAVLEYTVISDVNADLGLYKLSLNLSFEVEGGMSREISTKAGVFVGGETDFDVTFSESSAGQTSLSVANIGNTPALSVTVRIPEQNNFAVSGSTSSIIGNLDKGDYTIVSFQIAQTGGAMAGGMNRTARRAAVSDSAQGGDNALLQRSAGAGNNNLLVLVEYTDTTGVRRTVEKPVPIQFRSANATGTMQARFSGTQVQESFWTTTRIAILIVLIVVAGGIFVFLRKSRTKFARRKE